MTSIFLDVFEKIKVLFFTEKILDLLNIADLNFEEPIQIGILIHQCGIFVDNLVDLIHNVKSWSSIIEYLLLLFYVENIGSFLDIWSVLFECY